MSSLSLWLITFLNITIVNETTDPFECRRLMAALHYKTYDLPRNLDAAVRKVQEDIPCLEELLHWNGTPGEGKGKTHETMVHRLRQLNRNDLADWLGKSAFKQLGEDLEETMDRAFAAFAREETEISYPITISPPPKTDKESEDLSSDFDIILFALLLALLGTLIALMAATFLKSRK